MEIKITKIDITNGKIDYIVVDRFEIFMRKQFRSSKCGDLEFMMEEFCNELIKRVREWVVINDNR